MWFLAQFEEVEFLGRVATHSANVLSSCCTARKFLPTFLVLRFWFNNKVFIC